MEKVENSSNSISNECKTGNHDVCLGQIPTPVGTMECKCMHHKSVPTSVDDIPITSDTPWRVAHNG